MPRVREFKKLDDSTATMDHREVNVKIGENDDKTPKVVQADYWVPNSGKTFQAFVAELSGEKLDEAWEEYVSAVDATARQAKRVGAVADSTIIMVNGERKDIMDYTASKLVLAINAYAGVAFSTGKEMPNAFETAKRRLLANGKDGLSFHEIDNPAGEGPMLLAVKKS